MMMHGGGRALIIGGSLGGLFAAHFLRAIGWQVDVFERSGGDLADRGAGLGTHDALIAIMRRIGLDIDASLGVETRAYVCLGRDGEVIHEVPLRRVMTAWARIYRPLRDALPAHCYHAGCSLARIETGGGSVTAIFADGSRVGADLLVGADGLRSAVRAQFWPDVKPAYAGYVAWRALASETGVAAKDRSLLFEHNVFCIPEGELSVSYPVPARDGDVRPGHREYNVVWYRPVDAATLADLNTDDTGRSHEQIPPQMIRSDIVAAAKRDAERLLAPAVAGIFARMERPFFQPIYDVVCPRMVFDRVALLGDAAFVARPHVGAGVTKAALDAACLADALKASGDVGAALTYYDAHRRSSGEAIVARSRELGRCIGMNRRENARSVMGEYAALPAFVRDWAERSALPRGLSPTNTARR